MMRRTNLQSRPGSRGVVHTVITLTVRVEARFDGLGVLTFVSRKKKCLAE